MANTIVQNSIPVSATVTGTTGAVSLTLGTTAFKGRCVYLTGFSYQADATAATTVTITVSYAPEAVSGVFGGATTLGTWSYVVGTGTTGPVPLDINLIPPFNTPQVIDGVTNTTTSTAVGSITVSATAAGTGGVVALNAWGYLL